MDVRRVKEIIGSREKIDVYYREVPVWIENIQDGETVRVSFLDSKEQTMVQADQLEER